MSAPRQQHLTRIKPPFYQNGAGCGLHRYLDPDFVNRFKQDIQRRQFGQSQFHDWQEDERHSPHGREPVLRLPLHRAFHLVCCEVVCDHLLGQPALDPRRIVSAGFVIRRQGQTREQAWMLEDGEALGWQDAPAELRDPDLHRRLCARGVLHRTADTPCYSGEEVHPLHVMKTVDDADRTHTLLYGYLPLGGFYYHRHPGTAFDAASQAAVTTAAAEALPWPFGYRKPLVRTWGAEQAMPVDQGEPTRAMFELLRLLVNRYHLGEAGIAGNGALEKFCRQIWFYDGSRLAGLLGALPETARGQEQLVPYRCQDLFSYLHGCFARGGDNPLVRWIIAQEQSAADAARLPPLPASNGSGDLNQSLLLGEGDAEELRALLGQRLQDQTLALVREIPLPKFAEGAKDLYQVVPFVRFLHHDTGLEQIQWADATTRTLTFRVATPLNPEASRPSLIQMPSLADLRRGLAKGASIITPGDTFDLISSLKLNKGIGPDALPDSEPGPGLGIQWICSFSLPVISLVAMMLLMIMITLLNLVFFWMPWVRICIPFPKMK